MQRVESSQQSQSKRDLANLVSLFHVTFTKKNMLPIHMLEHGPKKFVILGHFLLLHMPEENKVVELYRKIDIRRNPQSSWRERKKKLTFIFLLL